MCINKLKSHILGYKWTALSSWWVSLGVPWFRTPGWLWAAYLGLGVLSRDRAPHWTPTRRGGLCNWDKRKKTKIRLTVKALIYNNERLLKEHKCISVNKIKGLILEIKRRMTNQNNAEHDQSMVDLTELWLNAGESNAMILPLFPQDEQNIQDESFSNICDHSNAFIGGVTQWLDEVKVQKDVSAALKHKHTSHKTQLQCVKCGGTTNKVTFWRVDSVLYNFIIH